MKQQTIKDFIDKNDIRLTLGKIPFRKDIEWEGNPTHWAYTLYIPYGERFGKKMQGFYSQGEAIKKAPKSEDILNSLIIDTSDIENMSFQDFCDSFGYDSDSIKAGHIYEACCKEYTELKNWLGNKLLNELRECETL